MQTAANAERKANNTSLPTEGRPGYITQHPGRLEMMKEKDISSASNLTSIENSYL